MLAIKARIPKSLPHGSYVEACDNSGAKVIKVVSVFGQKTSKGRYPAAGVGDLIQAAVKNGRASCRERV